MPNSDHRSKITIEDLLRLKRAERPAAEFWSNFERELRQKQLTALLEKSPWWQGLPRLLVRRAYLPLGASAVLAFTLVSVKFYAPAQVVRVESPSAGSVAALNRETELKPARTVSEPVSSPLINRHDQAAPRIDDRTTVIAREQSVAVDAAEVAPVATASLPGETPSARSIAANLANLEQSEPELMNAVLGSRLSPAVRSQTFSAPVAELASLSNNATKRSRLLANYNDRQLNPEPTAPDIVRERLSRRLGDTDYAERFSRIGLKGDQVSLGLTIKL
jgi:hypothetical protein